VLSTSALREEGYRQALQQHGILFDPALVMESDFTYEDGLRLADHILTRDPLPTAIFGSNDVVTIGCPGDCSSAASAFRIKISLAGLTTLQRRSMSTRP